MPEAPPLLLCCCFLVLLLGNEATSFLHTIGAIMDCSSRSRKEERVAMEMAIDDFRNLTGRALALQVRDSRRDPVRAASAAKAQINEQQVQAIIGPHTWEEAAFMAELGERARVPILSFADSYPPSASRRWPFLVRLARNPQSQMSAIAAIIRSWSWRRVTIIYEDIDYTATDIIPHLADALRDGGAEIDQRVALMPFSTSFTEELGMLRSRQCRVFVVHASMDLASHFFAEAEEMGMVDKEYVWITTDKVTSLLDTINSTVMASMQGILGVKNYFPPSARLGDFHGRFRKNFHLMYPEDDECLEPQLSALIAYDAVWAVARAMNRSSCSNSKFQNNASYEGHSNEKLPPSVSNNGQSLLEGILRSNFKGISGEFHFDGRGFAPPRIFQIVNVVGKSYREVGFWSYDFGFSEVIGNNENYEASMKSMGQIFWPGGSWSVPRGWAPPTSENPLKIAVPARAVFPEFVNVKNVSHNETSVEGFSIEVFKEIVKHLPYHLPYQFIPYDGTYDSLVEQDQMKTYDVLVGDTSISSRRYHYVEFSQPYTPSGLVMVVRMSSERAGKAWIFLKPFTASMWLLTALVSIYNGLVVWLIERKSNTEFQGSFWNQIGTLFWLSFTTLLSPREKPHSNLSRVAMVVWLFAALIITSNYTASLSSMLTAQRLQPNPMSAESLKSNNAMVGCTNGSVVGKYLEEVLGFHPKNIKKFAMEDDYRRALQRGEIKAAFLRIPHANLLLAKYCNEFATTGPVYNVGGLGFVFPKGSPLLSDISQALLQVFERGTIQKLERAMYASYNCSSQGVDATNFERLSPESFWGLFLLSMGTSTIALMLYGLFLHKKNLDPGKDLQEAPASKSTSGAEQAWVERTMKITIEDMQSREISHSLGNHLRQSRPLP